MEEPDSIEDKANKSLEARSSKLALLEHRFQSTHAEPVKKTGPTETSSSSVVNAPNKTDPYTQHESSKCHEQCDNSDNMLEVLVSGCDEKETFRDLSSDMTKKLEAVTLRVATTPITTPTSLVRIESEADVTVKQTTQIETNQVNAEQAFYKGLQSRPVLNKGLKYSDQAHNTSVTRDLEVSVDNDGNQIITDILSLPQSAETSLQGHCEKQSTNVTEVQPTSSTKALQHEDERQYLKKENGKHNDTVRNEKRTFELLNSTSTSAHSFDFATINEPLQTTGASSELQSPESRPIYPNVPYSPYASPYGSPHLNRRRPPLRESRRVSIEQTGSFLQLNQYKLLDQIGQGSYGLVKLAYSEEDSTHYAMKILSKRKLLRQAGLLRRGPKKAISPLDRVYREIAVLKKLDHPNVVKLIEVLDDPIEDSLYMVFELVKQGEVLRIPTLKPLSEERAWSIFRETLLGLEYLHYQRIIHADLKPSNLLLTECGHVKIADLGVCNEFIGEDAIISSGSTAGTPAFRAPETLNLEKQPYCGKAADIWALGITLYCLVFGNVPFEASSIPVLYEKIKNDELVLLNTIQISDELRDCIECILKKNPLDRITLQQLKKHAWVTKGGTCELPSEDENCCLVQVSDDDINSVVRSIPKLDTLILIKTMLKKHSFGNPFQRDVTAGGRVSQRGGSRLERFVRAGRSNSAPGAYNVAAERQYSADVGLPSLTEFDPNPSNEES